MMKFNQLLFNLKLNYFLKLKINAKKKNKKIKKKNNNKNWFFYTIYNIYIYYKITFKY